MNSITRRVVLIPFLLLSVLTSAALQAAGSRDPYKFFFDETFGDFSEELKRAKDAGKQAILVFFEMDECPFCHRMKETVLNQPQVQAYFKQHFLNFSVDIEGDLEITDFDGEKSTQKQFAVKKNRVRATPVFAFYDLDGKQIARYTGATNGIDEFLWLGEYVATGKYKDMPFAKYKRAKQSPS